MRAAAAITSITMNGGTSLRADGVISRFAASSIVQAFGDRVHRPAVAAFGGFRADSRRRGAIAVSTCRFRHNGRGTPTGAKRILTWYRGRAGGLSPQLLGPRMIETESRMASTDRTSTTGSPRLARLALARACCRPRPLSPPASRHRRRTAPTGLRSSATPRSSSCCATIPSRSCAPPASPSRTSRSSSSTTASFNAFVADGRRIFINAGALMDAEDAERGHRRARARDRPHRRRPSRAHARAAAPALDAIDHRPCCSASARWSPASRSGSASGANAGWRPFRRRRP